MMLVFEAEIQKIGVNPYVSVPEEALFQIFEAAEVERGPIPITGTVNRVPYKQTLVRYQGAWRLYINTSMLKNSPKRIGETIEVSIAFDPVKRSIEPHPMLIESLNGNAVAKATFEALRPSLKHEIVRYISSLKTESSVERNVAKAIDFLLGKGRFVGRDKL